MSAGLLGEWAAFEKHYGPLLIHERVDYGLAVVAATVGGGGEVMLPPWYDDDADTVASDDSLIAAMDRFGTRR